MSIPAPFNFSSWIEENQDHLKPPVNNKALHTENEDFIVQVVGGPNHRTDFHYEPYAEWFYQIKGDIHVNIIEDGKLRRVDIKEGDVWMLPGNTPHSPQRPDPESLGVVVEQIRKEGELEEFHWYCQDCGNMIYRIRLKVDDIQKDLPPAFEKFYATSDRERTCSECGTVHPGKGAEVG